jgi:hypothetical protein
MALVSGQMVRFERLQSTFLSGRACWNWVQENLSPWD